MTPFIVKNCTERIELGIRGEYGARPIVFDFAALGLKDFGEGTAVLLIKRAPDDTAYPAAVTSQDGDTLTWTPNATDTYYKGYGKAELFWYVGDDLLAKTIVFTTFLANDIGVPGPEPEPYEDWLEELTELAAEIAADALAAQRAQEAAETAQGAAEYAQGKAEDAQTAAETAQGLAEGAADRAEAAADAILDLTAEASVSNTSGTPAVTVNVTEAGGHKNMAFAFSGIKGETGAQGETGPQGPEGPEGPEGPAGQDGADGADGVSPEVTITTITGGHQVKITDADHPSGQDFDVMDGITPTIDSALSPSSENPVQNKVVTTEKADIITDTAQGSIASFPDGAPYPVLDLQVGIDPVQDLHGYSNPWPAGGGKNLFNKDAATENAYLDVTDGSVVSATGYAVSDYIPVYNGQPVYIPATSSVRRWFYNSSKVATTYLNASNNQTFYPAEDGYIRVSIKVSYAPLDTYQIEYGTAATSYAPYSNICPIQGWTGAVVARTNYQLLDESTVTAGAIDQTTGQNKSGSGVKRSGYMPIKPIGIYLTAVESVRFFWYKADDTYISTQVLYINQHTLTPPAETAKFRIQASDAVWNSPIMINYGSSAKPHEAYNGTTIPITWPTAGTVYGGEDKPIEGALTSERFAFVFTGQEDWKTTGTAGTDRRIYIGRNETTMPTPDVNKEQICSHYTYAPSNNWNYGYFRVGASNIIFNNRNEAISLADFKTYLQQQYAAGTPVTVVLYYATAQSYSHTPITAPSTLLGENNIWSDTGSVSVTYRADTQRYIQKLTGSTEEDMVANVNIAANKYFMVGGNLYYSTQSIASGETIKPGTNCTATNMADALNALNA